MIGILPTTTQHHHELVSPGVEPVPVGYSWPVATLVLGPMLRHLDARRATVWVETDAPCEVEVLRCRDRTFSVDGHHYALVVVDGLEPGITRPYEVHLDGQRVWPLPDSTMPPSVLRPPRPGDPFELVFGSCRVTGPHEVLPTSTRGFGRRSQDVDALRAYGLRMCDLAPEQWPDALLLLGDQIYADDVPPETEQFIANRDVEHDAPADEIADFEEYTRLYREAWSDPVVRWLLSTVPVSMIFDDHDVRDDWNTSAAWVETMRRKPWWDSRIVGGLMSYWVYQHLGNLSPDDLLDDEQYLAVRAAGDGSNILRAYARRADRETDGVRWSYLRDFGRVRLIVIDTRCGRVLTSPSHRRMIDDEEFAWLEEHAAADVDHVLLATTLPYLLPPALHHLEAWNEAVCAGRWGRAAAWAGEHIRQGLDLEHWAAFEHSFNRLGRLIRSVASGRSGSAPASIVVLSGDVHHAYVSRLHDPTSDVEWTSTVAQVVSSPLRHPMPPPLQWIYRVMLGRRFTRFTRRLAQGAGVEEPSMSWNVDEGPWFDNQIGTLTVDGRAATFTLERSYLDGEAARLETLLETSLTGDRDWPTLIARTRESAAR
jgi:PhoD-like phosphatase